MRVIVSWVLFEFPPKKGKYHMIQNFCLMQGVLKPKSTSSTFPSPVMLRLSLPHPHLTGA